MIKIKELRIWNYVLHDNNIIEIYNIISEYDGVNIYIDYMDYINVSELKPVKLTKEILLKNGFVTSAWDNHSTFRNRFCSDGCIVISLEHNYIEIGDLTLDIEIKYIHQLQNLYFALTNQELNIEL